MLVWEGQALRHVVCSALQLSYHTITAVYKQTGLVNQLHWPSTFPNTRAVRRPNALGGNERETERRSCLQTSGKIEINLTPLFTASNVWDAIINNRGCWHLHFSSV